MSATISMVRLRTLVSTPFGHLKSFFCNGPRLSHLDSHIVNTSQATPKDLSVQLTGAGVGRGPCEGSRKSNFTDREAPSGKYSTCEKWPFMCLKNYGQHFYRRNRPFGV